PRNCGSRRSERRTTSQRSGGLDRPRSGVIPGNLTQPLERTKPGMPGFVLSACSYYQSHCPASEPARVLAASTVRLPLMRAAEVVLAVRVKAVAVTPLAATVKIVLLLLS